MIYRNIYKEKNPKGKKKIPTLQICFSIFTYIIFSWNTVDLGLKIIYSCEKPFSTALKGKISLLKVGIGEYFCQASAGSTIYKIKSSVIT